MGDPAGGQEIDARFSDRRGRGLGDGARRLGDRATVDAAHGFFQRGEIIILRTNGEENTIKFSSRKSTGCKTELNLSTLMKSGAEKFNGIGGGHDAAAGAKITKDKLDGFLDYLEDNVNGNINQN